MEGTLRINRRYRERRREVGEEKIARVKIKGGKREEGKRRQK